MTQYHNKSYKSGQKSTNFALFVPQKSFLFVHNSGHPFLESPMEPVAIPKTIDDPIHLLLWSADEIVPFMVCMLTGMLVDQLLPSLAMGVFAVKFYRRFRDNRPDGYTLHAVYWLGLLPSNAITIPNPFIRRFYP
jgi:conjugal transfer pilus assembly protein TraL